LEVQDSLKLPYESYDIIGDIAIIRVSNPQKQQCQKFAETIMQTHKNIKSVWRQQSPVSGDHRLRTLEWIRGEKRIETVHKEFGCIFKTNIASCYFSPRLLCERRRIARLVQPNEVVVNMFAGVGCFSIIIAKHSQVKQVYSVDINPDAIIYMQENIRLNKVEKQVNAIQGDAKEAIKENLQEVADRVLMPLPQLACEYLEYAISTLKPKGGWIHYYDFEYARKDEKPEEKMEYKVAEKLRNLGISFEIPYSRVVRTTGPNWHQIVIDVLVRKT